LRNAAGGICEGSPSGFIIRRMSSLRMGSPGNTARFGASIRRFACRLFLSLPWQAKQLFERIGRMSRLKTTSRTSDVFDGAERWAEDEVRLNIAAVEAMAVTNGSDFF